MNLKIYIAGPMRGHKYYNFQNFDRVKAELEAKGYTVISPADIDRDRRGLDPFKFAEDFDWNTIPTGMTEEEFDELIVDDVKAVLTVDVVFMLKGWETSKGAMAERAIAQWRGKDVWYEGA